ncbi:unnamed protein product [Cochlearia groenlandica]
MAYKLLYCVIFLLLMVSRIWWETLNDQSHVYKRRKWFERLFESGFACLRVGFHEDQKYFRSYFLQ